MTDDDDRPCDVMWV